MDLSINGAPWQTLTSVRSSGADDVGIVLDWMEADELASGLGLILSIADDIDRGPRFEVRRASDSKGPVIFSADQLTLVDAWLDGFSVGKGDTE